MAVNVGHHDDSLAIFQGAKRFGYPSSIRVDDAGATTGAIKQSAIEIVEQVIAGMVPWIAIQDVYVTQVADVLHQADGSEDVVSVMR